MHRVLVTRLRYLGDVVMSTLVCDLLKAGDPSLEVDFLCETVHGPVLQDHPSIDGVHLLETRRRGMDARARVGGGGGGRGSLATVRELRRRRYDLAVDLFFNPRSAWILRLAGIPERIGGTRSARRRLYTRSVHPPTAGDRREILTARVPGVLGDHVARLAPLEYGTARIPFLEWLAGLPGEGTLIPRLPRRIPSPQTRGELAAVGIGDGYVVAAPAATWPSKEWPREHWRELLAKLPGQVGCPVKVIVPPGRKDSWLPVEPVQDLVALPPAPLERVLEVVGGAAGLVTVDGGVMHAAVAMGVPTLALFGPTDPGIWFPYADAGPYRVLATRPECHPCNLLDCDDFVCLPELGPSRVASAFLALLATGPNGEPERGTGCSGQDQT